MVRFGSVGKQWVRPLCDKPKRKSLRHLDVEYVSQHQLGVVDQGQLEHFTWILYALPRARVSSRVRYRSTRVRKGFLSQGDRARVVLRQQARCEMHRGEEEKLAVNSTL